MKGVILNEKNEVCLKYQNLIIKHIKIWFTDVKKTFDE